METDSYDSGLRLFVYDSGLAVSNWAAGLEGKVLETMGKSGYSFERDDQYDDVPSWRAQVDLGAKQEGESTSCDAGKVVDDAYKAYLGSLIDEEHKTFVEEPLESLLESRAPYFASLKTSHTPLQNDEIKDVSIDYRHNFSLEVKFRFDYVQYGYSFANVREGESLPRWQTKFIRLKSTWTNDSA